MECYKMAGSKKALTDFLLQHCEIKPITAGAAPGKDKCYVLGTENCLLFMAEKHLEEIRNAISQTEEAIHAARKNGDYSRVIMAYNWAAPEPGLDTIRIPFRVVEALDDRQALMMLRSLEGIQKDIEEGTARKNGLQSLFHDTATVQTNANLDGERVFLITGKVSATDRRRYAERYAEHVATNVLFDLPKALNAALQDVLPKESRGKFFVEGRDITARKIRFGADANIDLLLNDEGAAIYTALAKKEHRIGNAIGKILRQAMTDPFGLSLKYYMGKHALIKLPKKK